MRITSARESFERLVHRINFVPTGTSLLQNNCYTSLYLSKVRVDLEQISCVPKMSRRFYKIIGDGDKLKIANRQEL